MRKKKADIQRGRPGMPLEKEKISAIIKILQKPDMNFGKLADEIGITRNQLYFPVRRKQRCSEEAYKAITRFLEKVK
jgi:hypothetical protein